MCLRETVLFRESEWRGCISVKKTRELANYHLNCMVHQRPFRDGTFLFTCSGIEHSHLDTPIYPFRIAVNKFKKEGQGFEN